MWVEGEIIRLGVFCPPQHGKSELVSRHLPAYILGRRRNASIVSASYASDLAVGMCRDVQSIMDSERYHVLFPQICLPGHSDAAKVRRGDYIRKANEFEVIDTKGYYRCAGIRGSITGKTFDYGIIDDPVKDRQEADSPVYRRAAIAWYNTVFRTRRRAENSSILITQTRWHQGDLAGHLLSLAERDPEADQWEVLSLPGFCADPDSEAQQIKRARLIPVNSTPMGRDQIKVRDHGEALWKSCRGSDKFNEDSLRRTQAMMSPQEFSALYQQNPTPGEGVIFSAENFRYFYVEMYDGKPSAIVMPLTTDLTGPIRKVKVEDCIWFQTIDTAMKTGEDNDFTVITTMCQTPTNDLIIWDVWRGKIGIPYQLPAIYKMRNGRMPRYTTTTEFEEWIKFPTSPWPHQLAFQAVEEKSSGETLLQSAALAGYPLRALKADVSKTVRAASVATMYFSGKVWHKHAAEWLVEFEAEITSFPSGAHDDQVDTISYGGILVTFDALFRRTGVIKDFIAQHGFDVESNQELTEEEKIEQAKREEERIKEEERIARQQAEATGDVVFIRGFGEDLFIDFSEDD